MVGEKMFFKIIKTARELFFNDTKTKLGAKNTQEAIEKFYEKAVTTDNVENQRVLYAMYSGILGKNLEFLDPQISTAVLMQKSDGRVWLVPTVEGSEEKAAVDYATTANTASNADTLDGKHANDFIPANDTWDAIVMNWSTVQTKANGALQRTGGTMTGNIQMNGRAIYTVPIVQSNGALDIKSAGNGNNVNARGRLLNVINHEATSCMDVICLNLHYGGSLVKDSYRGVKENISLTSEERIRKILEIPVENFDYRPGFGNDQKDVVGVIVDEVEKVIPEAVITPENWNEEEFNELLGDMGNEEVPGVDKTAFVPYLIGMVQILNKEIEELKRKV